MKRFVMALALACILYGSALAGDVPSVGYAPPAPNETTPVTTSVASEITTGVIPGYSEAEIKVRVIQALISLLSF